MPVLAQTGRGLARQFVAAEQEVDRFPGDDPPQFVARLDVMQRAAVGGQIYALSVFFSAAPISGMDALRSSWRSMFWQITAASVVHWSSAVVSSL